MKRYRVLNFDFDTRVHSLTQEIQDHWEDHVKELHKDNRAKTELGLVQEFGELAAADKRQNFIDLGPKPLSILAFHNRFLGQIRVAFVMGASMRNVYRMRTFVPSLQGSLPSAVMMRRSWNM